MGERIQRMKEGIADRSKAAGVQRTQEAVSREKSGKNKPSTVKGKRKVIVKKPLTELSTGVGGKPLGKGITTKRERIGGGRKRPVAGQATGASGANASAMEKFRRK